MVATLGVNSNGRSNASAVELDVEFPSVCAQQGVARSTSCGKSRSSRAVPHNLEGQVQPTRGSRRQVARHKVTKIECSLTRM